MTEVHIPAGSRIQDAVHLALDEANDLRQSVFFNFNGERITVSPDDEPAELLRQWEARLTRRRREFQASPAYVEQQRKDAARLAAAQARVNAFIDASEITPLTPYTALKLLNEVVDAMDQVGILAPWAELAGRFGEVARAGTNVGRTDLDEPGRETDAALWLIGQAVEAFAFGHGPHPVLTRLAPRILDALCPPERTP